MRLLLLGDAVGLAWGGASAGHTVGRAVVRLSTEMECGTFFKVANFGQASNPSACELARKADGTVGELWRLLNHRGKRAMSASAGVALRVVPCQG